MLLPVAVARSGLAELAVVSVMVVRRPADDGGRAVGQRNGRRRRNEAPRL